MGKRNEAKFVITALDKTKATLSRVRSNFKKTSDSIAKMGAGMTMGLTAPIAAFGAMTVKSAADYETSMNRVRALTGASGDAFEALKDQAKDLGRTTQFSASEAADAMGFLAQAGFDSEKILASMPSTLNLAAAAQMDLAEAADITSNILTGYKKPVSELGHLNDVLVATTTKSNTNLSQMGEAMAYVAPVAAGLNVKFEETAAAIGLLGNAGIQGSMAGTSLRKSLSVLANPTAEAAAVMKRLGVNAKDSNGDLLPLADILDQFKAKGAGAADMLAIFGDRAGPGMTALVAQGGDALRQFSGDLENSGGTAERIASTQMEGFNGAMKRLKSAFEGLQIAIAESGLLTWLTNFTTRVAGWISTAATAGKETLGFAVKIAGIAAAVGPVMMIVGKLGAAIAWLTSPIGIAVTAIGLLVAAWNRWGEDIKKIIKPVTDWIVDKFDEMAAFAMDGIRRLLEGAKWLLEQAGKLPGKIGEDARNAAGKLGEWNAALEAGSQRIKDADDGAGLFKNTVDAVGKKVGELKDQLAGLGSAPGLADGEGGGGLSEVKVTVEGLNNALTDTGETAEKTAPKVGVLGKAGQSAMGKLKSAASQATDALASGLVDACLTGGNALEGLGNLAKDVLSSIASGLLRAGLTSLIPGLGALPGFGFAAGGDRVGRGEPTWVGDGVGRELFVPDSSGRIMTETQLRGGGGGQITNHNTIEIHDAGNIFRDPMAARRVAERIYEELEKVAGLHHNPQGAF